MKASRKVLALSGLAVAIALTGTGCNKVSADEQAAKPAPATRQPMEIAVTPDLMQRVKLGETSWRAVAGTFQVSGRVEADETRLARVSAPVPGRIMDLMVVEGQAVRRGDVIAVIRSQEISDAQSEFLKAHSQRRLAERSSERAKLLLNSGVISEAEVQRREAELVQAATELAARRDHLRTLGMSDDAIHKLETNRTMSSISQVVATIDGIVMERRVTLGQMVQAAEPVCLLADLSRVWLVADVPEQAAGSVDIGKSVEAEIPALPGVKIHGQLSFVSATVNKETRTVQIRMNLPNPQRRFKPAMLATMTLKDAAERQRVVPATALVREGNQDFVFVQKDDKTFTLRRVTVGGEYDDVRVISDGIGDDDRIVVDGAFHLNNERKRLALQAGA